MDLKQVVAPALAIVGIACAYYTWVTLNGKIKSLQEQLEKTHVLAASNIKVDDLKYFDAVDRTEEEEEAEQQAEHGAEQGAEQQAKQGAEQEVEINNSTALPRVIPRVLPNALPNALPNTTEVPRGPPSPASSTSGWSVSEGGAVGTKARRRRFPKKAQETVETASEE